MVSRCPSCGSPTPEEERICPSCGWDFVARKRTRPGPAAPAEPPTPSSPAAPPAPGGFALPPARNLGDAPPGLKPLPKLEPRGATGPVPGENPFTLPAARSLTPPEAPPPKPAVPEKRAPDAPPPPPKETPKETPKDGLGARLFRSLRGESKPAPPRAPKAEDVLPAPEAPAQKGFSLPTARIVEADETPAEKPREQKPRLFETPVDDVPVEESLPAQEAETSEPVKPEKRPEAALPEPAAFPEPAARFDGGDAPLPPPSAEPLLPTSARDVPAAPARPERPAPARSATEPPPAGAASSAAEARKSMVMVAAIAGAALGTVSVVAVYLLMRPDAAPETSGAVASPFGRPGANAAPRPAFPPAPGTAPSPSPAPAAAPAPAALAAPAAPVPQSPAPLLSEPPSPVAAPKPAPPAGPIAVPSPVAALPAPAAPAPAAAPEPSRPAATFASTPRLVVTGEASKSAPPPSAAATSPAPVAAAPAAEEVKPRRPKGPRWVFEGVVFDLLTARGVFGAKLIFVNADGDVVGQTDTGPAGRYKVSLPAGSGYKLKISHGDYTERYIDEGDAVSSLRDATPDERRMLMSAAARNLPWTGDAAKPVHRDLALVPKTPEEP
ncbi:MAG TPA: hypothetical protein VN915_11360 [Elusimicrobiota bacterium]|nr:hypothetical protein [Elusimicrobiota bacterium]